MGTSPVRQWATFVGALVVLVAVPGWWLAALPSDAAGVVPAEAAPTSVRATPAHQAPVEDASARRPRNSTADDASPPETPDPRPVDQVTARPARLADRQAPTTLPPARLRIDSLGVDAEVTPAGVVEQTGEFDVPEDVSTVGWYEHGPAPGVATGTAVMAGHVDSSHQGPGALFRLAELQPGDPVVVTLVDGTSLQYEVVGRRRYPKEALPTDQLFTRDGNPALALVTCGGDFDPDRRRYAENVVVWAVPDA